MAWTTCFFLPHWTTTPALFFFLNSLAIMAIDWSMRPVASLVRPWLFVALAQAAHALFAAPLCIAKAHVAVGAVLLASRWSAPAALALAMALTASLPAVLEGCLFKAPFNA